VKKVFLSSIGDPPKTVLPMIFYFITGEQLIKYSLNNPPNHLITIE